MTQQTEFDYLLTPDGKSYSFHDRRSGHPSIRWLVSDAARGMPDIDYIEQVGPYQNGSTVLDYRIRPRMLTLIHERSACGRDAYWDMRANMLDYMRPNRQAAGSLDPFTLRKILPDGSKRDIDCFPAGGPSFAARRGGAWNETQAIEPIKFYCPDPTFYDPDIVSVDMSGAFCDDLIFPFDFPFVFCSEGEIETDSITYTGTWLTYPTISVSGPVKGLTIRNLTTNEKLQLERDIPAGGSVTFTLAYGNKTITDNANGNWIGALSTDSNLATFHLAPDPEAPGGVNQWSITGYDSLPATNAWLSYYTRYIGI